MTAVVGYGLSASSGSVALTSLDLKHFGDDPRQGCAFPDIWDNNATSPCIYRNLQ